MIWGQDEWENCKCVVVGFIQKPKARVIWVISPFRSQENIAFSVRREKETDSVVRVCFHVYGCYAYMCVCAQIHEVLLKRVSDSLGLDLQMAVRHHHVGAGNGIRVFQKSSQWCRGRRVTQIASWASLLGLYRAAEMRDFNKLKGENQLLKVVWPPGLFRALTVHTHTCLHTHALKKM